MILFPDDRSISWVSCLFVGLMDTASTSLVIEQVPEYTGTMMSLSRAVTQIGFSIGSGAGGILLLFYGYQTMFLILGSLAVGAGLIFHLFTTDPTRS